MTQVTIAILNWNGKNWLEKFLPSVIATNHPSYEILVIDNGSTDDSISFLSENFPSVKVEQLDQNYGFTGGYNRAMAFIDTPYIVLLNSDVEVEPNWLGPLVDVMEKDPQVASVQPKIRAHHNKTLFEYAGAAGGMIDILGYPFCRGRIFDTVETDQGQFEETTEIFWATGACCLVRKNVIDEIGLFEETFFAHMEEIDFCWRAKNHGYKVMYEPRSVVYHVGGGALPQGSPRKTYLNARNSLSCMYLNLPSGMVFPKVFTRLVLDGVWGVKALLDRDFATIPAIIKAHFHFYGRLPYLRKRKKEIYQGSPKTIPQTGYFPKSIVWQYFIRGKKKWSALESEK
ncbi:MAG: glycosyltransferase family 2 protein [Bacteroidetes bacterium]|nr:glycosyltransferase family 2 protein [Bacteroidota bacterium]